MHPYPYPKLAESRLKFLANGPRDRDVLSGHEKQQAATIIEESAMAQEILELRAKVDKLQSVIEAHQYLEKLPAEPQPTKVQQTPDPEVVRLRQRLDMIEQRLGSTNVIDLRPANNPGCLQIYF